MNARDAARARLGSLGEAPRLPTPTLDKLDEAVLPPIRMQVAETRVETPTVFDKTGKLDELTDLALDKLRDILSEPFSPELEKLTAQQLSAAQTVLTTQTKVDDTRLRRRQTDMLPKIIEMIARHEKTAMKVVEATALVFLLFIGQAHAETCVASVYGNGDGYEWKRTASGRVMDPTSLTAAHKTLPLGSRATVTNLKNGRSVEVTIDNRGPFVEGRCIDVTPAVERRLGFSGLTSVDVR